jgi:hypothetical protein
LLIQKGAIFVTYPHGDDGWETDAKLDWQLSLLSLYNVLQGGWPSEAKKYLKPQSYKRAEQQINSSAPNLGSDKLVYDGKYNQILWSIKKLGIPDNVAFLDKGEQGVAEGRENYNGVNILFQKDDDEIFVKASAGGRELGHVLFVIDGDYLMPQDLEVEERFRGQGIAQTMYDYVKSKGYKIRRSGQQTDAGAGFWDKHKGQGQKVWEQGVAEASGYIPNAKQRNDPRWCMALTVDVKPDSIKKNAKAFGFKTSRAGIPPTARPDGKV